MEDRRSPARHKTFLVTDAVMDGAGRRVHVLNLSTGGALLHCAAAPDRGLVQVRIGQELRMAQVRWTTPDRLGVSFLSPIAQATISAAID